jgi:hypothetical protein
VWPLEAHHPQVCHAASVGDEDRRPVVEIWLTGGLTFESIGARLDELGYRPAKKSRGPDFSPSDAVAMILLYVAGPISAAVATELVRAVAEWAGGKVRRRKGGAKVTIWGPDLKPLAEVEVPDDESG